ncbi:MAG: hypothetical protein J5630_07785 [Bacteroidaceae bacterium]|nr:hypothetical protein [Bacteroidaceae bacterium]
MSEQECKKKSCDWRPRVQRILNTVFMVLAAAGVVQYFLNEGDHSKALAIIAVALCLKIIEFMIRFLG